MISRSGPILRRVWYKQTKTDLVATIALSAVAVDARRAQRVQQAADKLRAGGSNVDEGFRLRGCPRRLADTRRVRSSHPTHRRRAGLSHTRCDIRRAHPCGCRRSHRRLSRGTRHRQQRLAFTRKRSTARRPLRYRFSTPIVFQPSVTVSQWR